MKRIYWLLLALLTNTLFRFYPFCFQFGNPEHNHTSFAVGQAVSWVFLLLYIKNSVTGKPETRLFEITFWCAVSNTLDELFFNPIKLEWNEIMFAVFIITYECYKWKKDARISRKNSIY